MYFRHDSPAKHFASMALWSRKKMPAEPLAALQMPVQKISVRIHLPQDAARKQVTKKKTKPRKPKLVVSAAVKRRFESFLQKNRQCWTWKGSHTADGYAQFWLSDLKVVKAHRFAFEIYIRQLGKRERLRNNCENKQCVNPACWTPQTIGKRKALVKKFR